MMTQEPMKPGSRRIWIGIGVSFYIWAFGLWVFISLMWASTTYVYKSRPKPSITLWVLGNTWVIPMILVFLGSCWIWAGLRRLNGGKVRWLAFASMILGSLILLSVTLASIVPFLRLDGGLAPR